MSETILRLRTAIEHTILKPDTIPADIQRICREAAEYGFAAVCVPPYYVTDAAELLQESAVELATVIGFPYGYSSLMAKFEEAEDALAQGADHLDVVINIAAVKAGDWDTINNEMDMLTRLVHTEGKVIKYIAETGLMTEIETDLICRMANDHGIDYLKTSTGVNGPGASVEQVTSLRKLLRADIRIKASGGIRTREDAIALLDAGADRLGTSSGVALMADNAS